MREIKFRAWDKEKQFMFTPTQIELTQGENFAKWDKWRPMAWRDELPEEGSGGIGRALGDECELMQYTGLKDKYGTEIYEGDILRGPKYYESEESTSPVYDQWKVTYKNCSYYLGDSPIEEDLDWIGYECEVVGNIYENAELIQV
ncbi:hypothetical protein COL05_04740 [Bacillus sp. AFS059628]|uniref:YopX family protein n=1 Tax=Bacillus sp. AFS059628 TaxID=2033508 RepID=UPI000BF32A31|nr:YopX family protein [Bacillus sp. AFS059628]PFV85016.1 hypothetical protein COL05_04740 [Bacillus sp. AFS059628]